MKKILSKFRKWSIFMLLLVKSINNVYIQQFSFSFSSVYSFLSSLYDESFHWSLQVIISLEVSIYMYIIYIYILYIYCTYCSYTVHIVHILYILYLYCTYCTYTVHIVHKLYILHTLNTLYTVYIYCT